MKKVVVIWFFILTVHASATHIVGGSFTLKWINGNDYELTLKVMRDCRNGEAGFDIPGNVGMFEKQTNTRVRDFEIDFESVQRLKFAGPDCPNMITGACVEVGIYRKVITFSPALYSSLAGYYFAYERCCRNGIIQNLNDPGAAGIAIYMEVPSFSLRNSTPYYRGNPNTYLCVGSIFHSNYAFVDDDGDSLVFTSVTPLNGSRTRNIPGPDMAQPGPYREVTWANGFNQGNPVVGNPSLSINSKTGEISVNPSYPGIYSAAIKVEEYRFGKKIGEVRLELQFLVVSCPGTLAQIGFFDENGNALPSNVSVQIPGKVCVNVFATSPTDSLYMAANLDNPNVPSAFMPLLDSSQATGFKKASVKVCWQTDCSIAGGVLPVSLNVSVTNNDCPIPKVSEARLTLTPAPMPLVYSTDLLCMHFFGDSAITFYYGDTSSSNPYFSHFNIYRGVNDGPFVLYDTIRQPSKGVYHDPQTKGYLSDNNYKYQMKAVNKCGFEGAVSDILSTKEQLKEQPDKQRLITVTVENNEHIKVIWPKTDELDFAQYFLFKASETDTVLRQIKSYNKPTDTFYLDPMVDVSKRSYCYMLMMKDTCDNMSPVGRKACTMVISGKSQPFVHHLNWEAFSGWQTDHYEVLRADQDLLFQFINTTDENTVSFSDDRISTETGMFRYKVVAYEKQTGTDDFYGAKSVSNEIELIQAPLVYIPNVFTPNGDGVNDEWQIRDLFLKEYNLKVINKWGQVIFETTDKNENWKGTDIKGIPQQADVYIYTIHYTGWDGTIGSRKGNVTILK